MDSNGTVTPYIIDKNLGSPMDDYSDVLPKKNGDGLDIIEPTAEQKYRFDKDGWLLVPGVLSEQDIKEMREYCIQLHFDPQSLHEHERTPLAGSHTEIDRSPSGSRHDE